MRTKLIKMSQIARIAISRSCLSGWQRPAVVLSQQVNYKIFNNFHRTFRHFDFGIISYLQTSRALTTTTANKDIDSAAKFIGAGKYCQRQVLKVQLSVQPKNIESRLLFCNFLFHPKVHPSINFVP